MDRHVDYWCVIIRSHVSASDAHARDKLADICGAGFNSITAVRFSKIYMFSGLLSESDIRLIAGDLLTDPVVELSEHFDGFSRRSGSETAIEVHPLPGVMNPPALSVKEAAQELLGSAGRTSARVDEVQTARRYEISGAKSADELESIAARVLANDCVEKWYIQGLGRDDAIPDHSPEPPSHPFKLRRVRIVDLSDARLAELSRSAHLFLSLDEMIAIREQFKRLGRDPSDLELETLAQTWSEHCVHKTLKSEVAYRGEDFGVDGEVEAHFDNLLKDTIAAATRKLNREWCLSVFVDNAGVIAFDDEIGIAFKVETHNHPSAIEPYGGAATGVGGCIRDIMGCGLGAKPIASTDVFCLARPEFESQRVPSGVLHPARVLKGVVSGVRDYGNRMGIPTVNGAIFFDDRYLANPLVFCGCVGLIPRNRIEKGARAGDLIIVAGGRTGRDGIHGATFSSAELTDQHADEFSHAVQIGNAIEEKKVLDALLIARDHTNGCLYSAVTDCGAGGLSSAVGEMGADVGAIVELEKVPLKYAGLRYDEIWISEAQERMVFAVPPSNLESFKKVFRAENVEATVIGQFTDDRMLRIRFNHTSVGELDMGFLHSGLPKSARVAMWSRSSKCEVQSSMSETTRQQGSKATSSNVDVLTIRRFDVLQSTDNASLLAALRSLNVASKEWVIRQYDNEVQGRSVIKSLVGPGFGPSDAAVLRPLYTSYRGIALACGLCPELGEIDPYWMAIHAVDEALRNVICVGADPMRVAILDNFCWPKVDTEEAMGSLVRACRGAHDAAMAYGLPFISGKDSLNNEFSMSEAESRRTGLSPRIAIPPTLLISALGIVEDVRRCVSMDLKKPDSVLVLASCEPAVRESDTRSSPQVASIGFDLAGAVNVHHRVAKLIADRHVLSAHDVSDGGLAVALAEMCIAGGLGVRVELSDARIAASIFESKPCTYVFEMKAEAARDCGFPVIGKVKSEPIFRLSTGKGDSIALDVSELAAAWRSPLAKGANKS
ncbi:MAG: phosphoribosylformylglycinamidine synthase subunit PurL [Planctomycetes bacterium]|nr:phosphoribosylformylglycinamidine synthase subunit PurL [Planctomycetota bacterium]